MLEEHVIFVQRRGGAMSRSRNAALLPPLLRNVTPFAVQNRVYRHNKRNQLTERTDRVSMHSLEANAMRSFAGDASQGLIEPCFRYTPEQVANAGEQPYVSDVVLSKVERREFFYGIEITAQSNGKLTCVDFNSFLPILPSFISIVWLPHYWNVTPLERVETLQMIRHLEPYIPAMPHFSVYKQTKKRINEFLSLNFKNLLAVRGDKRDDNQFYLYGYQLIEHARRVRKGEYFNLPHTFLSFPPTLFISEAFTLFSGRTYINCRSWLSAGPCELG